MKYLKIKVEYIILSDLKKLFEKLTDELEMCHKNETEESYFEIESNIGGDLKAEWKNEKIEDLRSKYLEQLNKK